MFTGIGGFDIELEKRGHTIVGACEIDKFARDVFEKHFPNIPLHKDATKINPKDLPDFDLLVAGFPCQAFSIAGKRRGFEDTRGTLFFEIARIAQEKRPQYLLLENVKGLLSHERGKTVRKIYQTLNELGYDTQSSIINTKDFLPQNRERIFIIGYLRGESSGQIFPLRSSSKKDNRKIKKVTGYSQCSTVYNTDGLAPTISACTHGYAIGNILVKAVSIENTGANGRRIKDHGDPQFCLSQNCGVGILYNHKIRRLTPIECERLQGFSDNYTEGLWDNQRYKCLGNAVSVPVVEHVLSLIEKHFSLTLSP